MIGTRVAVALSLLISVAAVVVGTAGFVIALREDGTVDGRQVQTRLNNSYEGEPVLFPLDDFYFSRGEDGTMRALYVYPPGYFGHVRGCRVSWIADDPDANSADDQGRFADPCSGARFSASGGLISGPADRGLDYFDTSPAIDGIVVDTRQLFCGDPFQTPTPGPTNTPVLITPVVATPPAPGVPQAPTPAVTATPTISPSATATPSPEPTTVDPTVEHMLTQTAEAGPQECERVTSDSEE